MQNAQVNYEIKYLIKVILECNIEELIKYFSSRSRRGSK